MARRRRASPSIQRDVRSSGTASPDASVENLPAVAVVQQEINQELSQLEPQTRVRVRQSLVRIAHEVAEFSGPLPPPSYLRDYETVVTGAASRIIAMAENEQTHRHRWEMSALRSTTIGLWFGFRDCTRTCWRWGLFGQHRATLRCWRLPCCQCGRNGSRSYQG